MLIEGLKFVTPFFLGKQCFDYTKPGQILVKKSYGVGKGTTLKNPRYNYDQIPTQHMAGILKVPFTKTDGSADNVYNPKERERDSQVLTRDVPICQMCPKFRASSWDPTCQS